MGVPVLSLAGNNFVSRMGGSFLTTLGHPDWVASDAADFVAKAAGLAARLAELRAGRPRLRRQMATSPLCDINSYVKHLEALYGRMWALHCAGDSQRLIQMGDRPEGFDDMLPA